MSARNRLKLKVEVGILPFPALGRMEFYREFTTLTQKVKAAQAGTDGVGVQPAPACKRYLLLNVFVC